MTDSDGLDARYVSAFDIVRSEARVDILLALSERAATEPGDPAISFSSLHEATDIADSGQFNYHLDKLTGHLVQSTEEGYKLTPRGHEIVGAILSGAFAEGEDRGPEPIESTCPFCEAGLQAAYEQGQIVVTCEAGHQVFTSSVPNEMAANVPLEEALLEALARARWDLQKALSGTCSYCYGPVEWSATTDREEPPPVLYEGQCSRCGVGYSLPPAYAVFFHPGVVSFFWDHGVDVREVTAWEIEDHVADQAVVSADPFRARVTFRADGDRLEVEVDDATTVRSVTAEPATAGEES